MTFFNHHGRIKRLEQRIDKLEASQAQNQAQIDADTQMLVQLGATLTNDVSTIHASGIIVMTT